MSKSKAKRGNIERAGIDLAHYTIKKDVMKEVIESQKKKALKRQKTKNKG